MVKFISYDGHFPNLCSGTLMFEVNNKTYSLNHCLLSGGGINLGHGRENVETGPWSLTCLPDELKPFEAEITEMVNENIPWDCCGGCI